MTADLYRALFAPSSVALVGASDVRGKPTARPLEFLRQHGWAGEIYPVNPKRDTVLGERTWSSLAELPTVPDHALILTPADAAVDAVRQCADLGVTVATVVADGFLPGTPDGDRRRRELREILDRSALRLVGPSSLGVATVSSGFALTGNAAFAEDPLPQGDVFIGSQSGSVLGALLSRGVEMGVGFAGMVSVGNEFDISLGEVCLAAVDDPAVASFALFLENLSHADELAAFARAAAERGKPVIAYKLGRSDDGARLSVSHTGALAGDDAVAEAFLSAHGIARVQTFDALLEGQLLARRIPVSSTRVERRVAVVSTTGGGGAMAVDCLASAGLRVTAPEPATAARLAEVGVETGHGALIDLTLAGATYDTIKAALDVLLSAREFDAVVAVPGSSARFTPDVSVKPIVDSAGASTPLAVFVVPSAPDALHLLRGSGVPAFRTAESLADAMTAVFNRAPVRPETAVPPAAADGITLDEDASYAVLDTVGLASAPRVVLAVDDLPSDLPVSAPAVVKVVSGEIAHKSDLGGVVLNIADAAQLRAAVTDIRSSIGTARPDVTVDRVMVQQMVRGVAEVLIGLRRDPHAGPVVVLAAGGVLAEVYRDRSVRMAPVDLEQAREMIDEVRSLSVAKGFRGAPRGDLDALADAIVAVSRLAVSNDPVVVEAEANPVLVLREGEGVLAVDAVVTIAETKP
jgi:acyl-CoA synthetase (NDP forming)